MAALKRKCSKSGRRARVVPQQSAEELFAHYSADIVRFPDAFDDERSICRRFDREVTETLVRPVTIVESHVFLTDVVKVPKAEASKVVQALALE